MHEYIIGQLFKSLYLFIDYTGGYLLFPVGSVVYAPLGIQAPFIDINPVSDIKRDDAFVVVPLDSIPQLCIRFPCFPVKQKLTMPLDINFFQFEYPTLTGGSFTNISPLPVTSHSAETL
jgi:hypothetical protein